jgi:hypothetical protein
MLTYAEMLRDPRWQRRRLEIMQSADFRCELCGSAEKTLNVHHRQYRKGAKPWEYDDEELRCMCEDCHREDHENSALLLRIFDRLDFGDKLRTIGYLWGLAVLSGGVELTEPFCTTDRETAMGIADALECPLHKVLGVFITKEYAELVHYGEDENG